jgi:hypothetical protein
MSGACEKPGFYLPGLSYRNIAGRGGNAGTGERRAAERTFPAGISGKAHGKKGRGRRPFLVE